MSGAIATAIGTAVAGSFASSLIGGWFAPDTPTPPTPTDVPKPQYASTPDAQATRASMNNSGGAGGSPTAGGSLLTGASGVDPKDLKLGKNQLLGA